MSLEEAISKTGSLPARRFGLQGRGTITPGNWADLVVFDPATVGSPADYASPAQAPEGIEMVFVNGERVAERGKLTGERAGATLRHFRRSKTGE
jgi:N-acyl-D-amino-acid deacylase